MPIRGFFSDTRLARLGGGQPPTAVPYVLATVYLPQFDRRATVTFLIDTGADVTILHPQDSLRLLVQHEILSLPNPQPIGGAGAGANHYPVDAVVQFLQDDGRLHAISLRVFVPDIAAHNVGLESLLGRDALEHFAVYFDRRAQVITLGA